MPFRTRITLAYAGLLALVIALFSLAVFLAIRVTIINAIDEDLNATATQVIRTIRVVPVGEFGSLERGITFRSDHVFRIPGTSVQVWQLGEDEALTLRRSSLDLFEVVTPLDANTLTTTTAIYSDITFNNMAGRVITRIITTSGGQQVGVVQVATSSKMIIQITEAMRIFMISFSILVISLSIAVGMILSWRALKPLDDVADATERIALSDDLTIRLPNRASKDEIGRLTRSFNHMMGRLENLFQLQKRFVSDLSHELRTPLTTVQGNLELIERYGLDESSMEAMKIEVERMSRMINEALTLVRADYGNVTINRYPLELDPIALEAYEEALQWIDNRPLNLSIGRMEATKVNGNHDYLKQLIMNLLHNAIKFTPDNGAITLSVYSDKRNAIIEVQDTGIGIAKDEQSYIFERFYQVDTSRTQHSDSDGAGLGLSIGQWIVESHEGTISVDSELGKGSTFKVILPIMTKQEQKSKSKL